MAAEAYILDDLEPAERNAFEEHFFDCTDCASDVLDAAAVADGVRTDIADGERTETTNVVPFPHPYSRWAAAAAAIAIAAVLSYHYWPRPPARQTAPLVRNVVAEQMIDLDAARATQTSYLVIRNQSVSVGFVIPVTDPHPPYVCELRDDAGGHLMGSKTVSTKDEAANAVSLVIPAGKFHNGNYTLGIRGDREIPAYHFAVEVK